MTFPMYAEQPMGQPPNLNESGMRLYNDSEVDLLINEISEAALEAVEQAAGEAAKAAVLSVLERETAALREAAYQQAEALRWRIQSEINAMAIKETKKKGIKNAFIAGVACLFSGLVIGIGGTIYLGGR
jgi:4-hydroxyphenylpyruvate dioxygenase-like putative hemolysin